MHSARNVNERCARERGLESTQTHTRTGWARFVCVCVACGKDAQAAMCWSSIMLLLLPANVFFYCFYFCYCKQRCSLSLYNYVSAAFVLLLFFLLLSAL